MERSRSLVCDGLSPQSATEEEEDDRHREEREDHCDEVFCGGALNRIAKDWWKDEAATHHGKHHQRRAAWELWSLSGNPT